MAVEDNLKDELALHPLCVLECGLSIGSTSPGYAITIGTFLYMSQPITCFFLFLKLISNMGGETQFTYKELRYLANNIAFIYVKRDSAIFITFNILHFHKCTFFKF